MSKIPDSNSTPIEGTPIREYVTNRITTSAQPTHLSVLVLNSSRCLVLTADRTLDELPDQVFVALSRRGMEPLPLKECTYECDGDELHLLEVTQNKEKPAKKGIDEIFHGKGGLSDHLPDGWVLPESARANNHISFLFRHFL